MSIVQSEQTGLEEVNMEENPQSLDELQVQPVNMGQDMIISDKLFWKIRSVLRGFQLKQQEDKSITWDTTLDAVLKEMEDSYRVSDNDGLEVLRGGKWVEASKELKAQILFLCTPELLSDEQISQIYYGHGWSIHNEDLQRAKVIAQAQLDADMGKER